MIKITKFYSKKIQFIKEKFASLSRNQFIYLQ